MEYSGTVGSVLRAARERAGLSQRQLARLAGTTQATVARIEGGRVSPTFATLERLAAAAGAAVHVELVPHPPSDPVIDAYKRDVDRTLLRENLTRSVDERLESLADLQEFGDEVRRGVREAKRSRGKT